MNRYRIGLTVLTVLFVIIAIFSSMIGVGLLQGFLILVASLLLLGIFIGGTAVFGWREFWWGHFKPDAAVPIAWGLLHLAFVLVLPDVPPKLWALHWKIIIVIELCAFITCWILNKKEPLEKRASRKLLMLQYICLFIMILLIFGYRLFFGEFTANLNREMLYRLVSSEVELTAENIEKFDKKNKSKYLLSELDRLTEKSKKRSLSKLELARVERLKEAVKKKYAVPDEKKIDWQKLWPFGKSAEAQTGPSFAGDFEMPAAAIQNLNGSWRVPVSANRLEVDSTLEVKKGQGIIITATGQVNSCKNRHDGAYGWTGPEGRKWSWNKDRKRVLGQDAPFMALCAKVGESGKWFKVGRKISFRVLQSGKIFFTVNDDIYDASGRFRLDWRKDNEGRFIVKVIIDC